MKNQAVLTIHADNKDFDYETTLRSVRAINDNPNIPFCIDEFTVVTPSANKKALENIVAGYESFEGEKERGIIVRETATVTANTEDAPKAVETPVATANTVDAPEAVETPVATANTVDAPEAVATAQNSNSKENSGKDSDDLDNVIDQVEKNNTERLSKKDKIKQRKNQ